MTKNKHKTSFTGGSVLAQFSRDLTQAAHDGKLDPVIGRDYEIRRVTQILSRRGKNNPVLIGEAGVGKTAIVEGLAERIASGKVPSELKGKRVLSLDLSSLVAGTKYRGEFEKRLKSLMDEIIKAQRNIILFIDEIHQLIEAGQAEGAIDAEDIFKPALSRGELQVIGATTSKEYDEYIRKDVTLERRFQPIVIHEPDKKQTVDILEGIKKEYEEYHEVIITDDAVNAAVEISEELLPERSFPDKAIDLIDEAASKVKLELLEGKIALDPNNRPQVTRKDIEEIAKEIAADRQRDK